MASMLVECSSCQSELVYRHGKTHSGLLRYRCRDGHHCFRLDYLYEANKPAIIDKITEMSLNDSDVRDIGRALGDQHHHRDRPFKKPAPTIISPIPFSQVSNKTSIELVC